MELHTITIRQFKEKLTAHSTFYRNDIILTNHVDNLDPFRYPCRLEATLVLVCVEGCMEFSVNLKRYRMESRMMVVVLSGDMVCIHQVEALEAYAILLSSAYLSDLQIDFRQRSRFYLNIRNNAMARIPQPELEAIVPYYPLIKANMERNREDTPAILDSLVRAFCYSVISLMQLFGGEGEEADAASSLRNRQLFDKFMALLKLHHCTRRDGKFYADKLCLTPNYLSGALKEFSGKSMSQWINESVTLEAKALLKNTDLSIQEIAYRLNFPTQSAFGKYFKLQTGMGPKAYRRGED